MFPFLKRQPAARWAPLAGLCAAINISLMTPLLHLAELQLPDGEAVPLDGTEVLGIGGGSGGSWISLPIAQTLLTLIALQWTIIVTGRFLPMGHRVSPFERCLPVAPRSVILQRAATLWVALAVPVLCGLGALAAWGTEAGALLVLGRRTLLGVTGASVLLFAYRPGALRLRGAETLALTLAAAGLLLGSAQTEGPAGELVAAAVAALGAAWWWAQAPRSHGASPRVTARPDARQDDAGALPLSPLRWTILRSSVLRSRSLGMGAMLVVAGAFGVDRTPMVAVFLPFFVAVFPLRFALQSLRGLGSLPIGRERLVRPVAALTLLVIVVPLALSAKVDPRFYNFTPLRSALELDGDSEDSFAGTGVHHMHLRVPPHAWRITGDRADLVIEAPWGETATVMAHPLWPGAPLVAYCPYDVAGGSTVRFLAWQATRAARALHGYQGPDTAALDLLTEDVAPDRIMEVARFPADVLEPLRAPERPGRGRGLAGLRALYGVLLWLLGLALVLRPNVPDRRGRLWSRFVGSEAAVFAPLLVLMAPSFFLSFRDPVLIPVIEARLAATLDAALGGSVALWIAMLLALAGAGYALLARRVDRIEEPRPLVNGWTKEPFPIY